MPPGHGVPRAPLCRPRPLRDEHATHVGGACDARDVTDDARAETLTLWAAPGLDMLHTVECPHLTAASLKALTPATDEQRESMQVCSSCRGLIDGDRRQTFDSLDEALEAFAMPLDNRPRVRQIAAGLSYGRVWIPASGSYIGIAGAPGTAAVAYFGKGYADVHHPGGYSRELLPAHDRDTSRGTNERKQPPEPPVCPTCYTQLPVTGRCDQCDT